MYTWDSLGDTRLLKTNKCLWWVWKDPWISCTYTTDTYCIGNVNITFLSLKIVGIKLLHNFPSLQIWTHRTIPQVHAFCISVNMESQYKAPLKGNLISLKTL